LKHALSFTLLACAGCSLAAAPTSPVSDGGASIVAGQAAVALRGCPACHDPGDGTLSGQTTPRPGTRAYGANLTPDPDTGLGGWSDEAIARAIRTGVDDQLAPLCPPMPRFATMDDGEVAAIVAFLRSLPPVRNDAIPVSSCPPLKGGTEADLGATPDGAAGDGSATDAAATDGGAIADAAAAADAASPDGDMVGDAGARAPDGAAGDGGATLGCTARINEVQTGGPLGASDEFVEIVNPCATAVDLGGWRLAYRSAAGATDVTLVAFAGALAPGARRVCGGKG
jgi:hypothetical protein